MEVHIGKVTHYWDHIHVAGVVLNGKLKVGDKVHIKGHTTDLEEIVGSIHIEHVQVQEANVGDSVGITVAEPVREHDEVFVIVLEE